MGQLGAKTKSKAKGKSKVRKALGRSLNGWKWAIGYVWNGQWARDVARVAFSGAEQRARDKAFVGMKKNEERKRQSDSRMFAETEYNAQCEREGKAPDRYRPLPGTPTMSEFVDQEAAGRSPKSTNGETIHSAIQNAAKKVGSTVDVSAHERSGTKGVKAYTIKRTPAQKRTEVLKNMLEPSTHDDQLAQINQRSAWLKQETEALKSGKATPLNSRDAVIANEKKEQEIASLEKQLAKTKARTAALNKRCDEWDAIRQKADTPKLRRIK